MWAYVVPSAEHLMQVTCLLLELQASLFSMSSVALVCYLVGEFMNQCFGQNSFLNHEEIASIWPQVFQAVF